MITSDTAATGAATTMSAGERFAALRDEVLADPQGIQAYEETGFRIRMRAALKSAREDTGLTQTQVAKRMGTTQSSVSDVETGRVDPQLSTVYRHVRALGKELRFLVEDPSADVTNNLLSPVVGSLQRASKAQNLHQIADDANLPPWVVSAVLAHLTEIGWATETIDRGVTRTFQLVPARIIGISLHGDHMVGVLTDAQRQGLTPEPYERKISPNASSPNDVLELAFDLVADMYHDSKQEAPHERILGVGVTVAGIVDSIEGLISFAPDLLDRQHPWHNVGFEDSLQARVQHELDRQMLVVVENDANALALARRTEPHASWAAVLMSGAGIGSAVMTEGRIFRGANSAAGEIGHVIVDHSPEASPCRAGLDHSGCLESVASNRVLLRKLGLPSDDFNERRQSFEAINSHFGEKTSTGEIPKVVFREAGRALGEALSRFDILDLQYVVIYASPFLCDQKRYASAKQFRAGVKESLTAWRARERNRNPDADVFRQVPTIKWEHLESTAEASAAAAAFTLLTYFLDRPDRWYEQSPRRLVDTRGDAHSDVANKDADADLVSK